MSASSEASPAATPTPSKGNGKGRRVAIIATLVVAAAGLLWFGWWFIHRNQVSTDDAYIHAHIAQIAPRVTGTVAQVFIHENQTVKKGQTLFTLDPADFNAALHKAKANLTAARASYTASQNALAVTRRTSAAHIASAQAALAAARAEAQRAAADAHRYRALFAKHEVSRQQLDQTNTEAKSTSAKVRQAQAQLDQAQAAPQQIALKKSQASSAKARIAQAKAAVEQARLNVSYTKIRAPHAGRIAKKSIVAGSRISAGQAAMALVETGPWVVANLKETQLDRVRPGQPVNIAIDAYRGRHFHGRVQSIQPGTGVTFSLLPAQNATGNFVKIVQRVPVKIVFSRPDELRGLNVAPGMSVVPTINVAGPIHPPTTPPGAETGAS